MEGEGHLTSVRNRHRMDEQEFHSEAMAEDEPEEEVSTPAAMSSIEVEMQPLTAASMDSDDAEFGLVPKSNSGHAPLVVKKPSSPQDWRQALEDWLFPPELPRSCQLLRPENIAVPMCYLLVGLLQGLSSPLVNVFPLDLGATEAQQTTISSIRSLPASFKLVFGFLSDNLPVNGYRRKPYMFLGWFMASLSIFSLIAFSNLDIDFQNRNCFKGGSASSAETNGATDKTDPNELPPDAPSVTFFSLCLLGFGTGFWVADVMGDSIVAEKAKLEPEHSRGSVQSSCYSYRFFGMMVAAPFSTYLYSEFGPHSVIFLLSILPLTILPLIYMLYEDNERPISSTRDQCMEIWKTVCSRAVWQPMLFVYLYNTLQIGNAAWKQFMVTTLGFSTCQLNLILVVSLVLLYLGILAYKYFFINWSWRSVYVWTTALNGIFSLLQILLIKGITFGLSNFWFALGDDVFSEFIQGIQFLPTTIMMVHLCPQGSEGASYAMFTTVNNSALSMASALSTRLLPIWDVSKQALQEGRLQGMINLTYFTTALQVGAIVFVGLLPKYKEDLVGLMNDSFRSKIGGTIFLLVTFASLTHAILVGFMNIVFPGWMGES